MLEQCKAALADEGVCPKPLATAISGGMATIAHDAIMTPMDVIKQRLQLGYYSGMLDCANRIYMSEGLSAFYRSFPMTLFMNIPFGCIMVSLNETFKNVLQPNPSKRTMGTFLLAGSGAGCVAAFLTTPLDVVKTKLQTQVCSVTSIIFLPSFKIQEELTVIRETHKISSISGTSGISTTSDPFTQPHTNKLRGWHW